MKLTYRFWILAASALTFTGCGQTGEDNVVARNPSIVGGTDQGNDTSGDSTDTSNTLTLAALYVGAGHTETLPLGNQANLCASALQGSIRWVFDGTHPSTLTITNANTCSPQLVDTSTSTTGGILAKVKGTMTVNNETKTLMADIKRKRAPNIGGSIADLRTNAGMIAATGGMNYLSPEGTGTLRIVRSSAVGGLLNAIWRDVANSTDRASNRSFAIDIPPVTQPDGVTPFSYQTELSCSVGYYSHYSTQSPCPLNLSLDMAAHKIRINFKGSPMVISSTNYFVLDAGFIPGFDMQDLVIRMTVTDPSTGSTTKDVAIMRLEFD